MDDEWIRDLLAHRVTLTVAIVCSVLLLRGLLTRRVRRRHVILNWKDRRDMSTVHVVAVSICVISVIALWFPQIQHFVLSITAIAVALVIATKELLLCLTGAILIRTSRAFSIGDWVLVGNQFGEVIERNFMSTTLQEIESRSFTYTGRTVIVPNSQFLSNSVVNQNFLRRYQFHSFSITIEPDAFPIDAEEKLLKRIEAITRHFNDTAQRYNKMLEQRTGIDIPDAKPSLDFSTNEIAKIVTTITVFCPTEEIMMLEKAMIKEFFDWYRSNRDRTHSRA
ncbi:MAG: mechanosensitive ion channel family protein [Granulosicoccus sp.]